MNRFVIVGVQRTGTTLIRTTLGNHPDIFCEGEVFKLVGRDSKEAYPGDRGYPKYIEQTMERRIRHYLLRKQITTEYLDHFYAVSGYMAVGFKLMLNQSQQFQSVVPYLQSKNVKVIRVIRENALKTLVSRRTAQARGKHHSTEKVGVTRIRIPVDDLKKRLSRIELGGQRWSEIFSDKERLDVVYERYLNDRNNEVARMLDYLEVAPEDISSPLVKLNPDSLSAVVENYREVCQCLRGSRFEKYLD